MNNSNRVKIHIVSSEQRPDIPAESSKCELPECDEKQWEMGFGLEGGGYGFYIYCNECGKIVSKTQCEE